MLQEMVIDEYNEVKYPRYLVYDIVTFKGQEVGKTDFDRRLLCINKEIVGARNTYIREVCLSYSVCLFFGRLETLIIRKNSHR